jgi:anthranilate/para-aminobenzoate synthase component I
MTGAPKLRSVEILAELEGSPRGPYSGCIGWVCVGGSCEMSVCIRTAVFDEDGVSMGAGGAVVVLSEIEGEVEEMRLKGMATLPAVGMGVGVKIVLEE